MERKTSPFFLFHQLNAALNEVVQCFACEHVVLQQCDVDELLYGVVNVGSIGQFFFKILLKFL
jgi:hypothetical protein